MKTEKYNEQEFEGSLLWCLSILLDELESVTKEYVVHKRLQDMTPKEFVIENADQGLGIVMGQLGCMGIDWKKLIEANKIMLPLDGILSYVLEDNDDRNSKSTTTKS